MGIVITGLVLAAGAWSGLIWLIANTLPTVPNRWLFFALLQIGMTGMALPFVTYLHRRFGRGRNLTPLVLIRQASWVGLFATTCAWLRIPRLLSLPIALLVLGALIVIEVLLRVREVTRWRPE